MLPVEDVVQFNAKWVGVHFGGRFPEGVVTRVPGIPSATHDVEGLVLKLVGCFVQPVAPIDLFSQLAAKGTSAKVVEAIPAQLKIAFLGEWLALVRLKSKDALIGAYSALRHMHLDWEKAHFFAGLTTSQIHNIAVMASLEKRVLLEWAWPERVFSSAAAVHPNVHRAWAFALAA